MERLPFPQKTDVKVMLLGKNSEAVRTKRIVELVRRPLPSRTQNARVWGPVYACASACSRHG